MLAAGPKNDSRHYYTNNEKGFIVKKLLEVCPALNCCLTQTLKEIEIKRAQRATAWLCACGGFAANVRVFAKAGNSLIVQPGTNAHLKICC
jgi:hypothetical protein